MAFLKKLENSLRKVVSIEERDDVSEEPVKEEEKVVDGAEVIEETQRDDNEGEENISAVAVNDEKEEKPEETQRDEGEEGEGNKNEDKQLETEEVKADQDNQEELKNVQMIRNFPENLACGVVYHDQPAYDEEGGVKKGVSLEYLADPDASHIRFQQKLKLHAKAVLSLQSSKDFVQSNPMPLYHDGVLWSYALRVTREKEQKNAISLVSIGPHLGIDATQQKGGVGRNHPRGLESPPIHEAKLALHSQDEDDLAVELMVSKSGNLMCPRLFSVAETESLVGSSACLSATATVIVSREYFSIQLPKTKEMTRKQSEMIERMASGEKTSGWDWVVTTGGDDSTREFFLHRKALSDASECFRAVIETQQSYADVILHVSHEDRVVIPALTSADMAVFLPMVYCSVYELPDVSRVAPFGRFLCRVLPRQILFEEVFPAWEARLIRQARELDKSATLATSLECVNLLSFIYSCPYGVLPLAKRVVLSIFTDTIHQSPVDLESWLSEELIPSAPTTSHMSHIIASLSRSLAMLPSVSKCSWSPSSAEWASL